MTRIRVIGRPSQTRLVVMQLSRLLPVRSVSDPKPCRRARKRGLVRVYVEVR